VAEGLDLVFISDNELLIQFGTRSRPSELLRDRDLTGILRKTVGRLLRSPQTLEDLLAVLDAEQRPEARKLLEDLFARGVVTDVETTPVEQYLRYTFTGECSLRDRSVTIIGAGPIGARIAQNLLLHGVTRIAFLDDRKTDEIWSSLVPFAHTVVGASPRASSEALRDALLAASHPDVQSVSGQLDAEGVEAAVLKSDFSILALEQPNVRLSHFVNRFCIRHRKPWMIAAVDGNFGLVGPLFIPVHTACYNDYQVLADAATASQAMVRKHRQYLDRRPAASFFPGLPAYADIVSSWASLAVVNFLLRNTSFVLGRVTVIDFDSMAIETEDVLKMPRCPVCSREKPAYRPPFGSDLLIERQKMEPVGAPASPVSAPAE